MQEVAAKQKISHDFVELHKGIHGLHHPLFFLVFFVLMQSMLVEMITLNEFASSERVCYFNLSVTFL